MLEKLAEKIFEECFKNKRIETILQNKEKAMLSKKLVTLKKDVLDPQGKVVQQTLKNMGYKNIFSQLGVFLIQ